MEKVTRNTEIADGRKRRRTLWADVTVPTYKPGKKFSRLLKMLSMQTYSIDKITVMNTEKAYWNDKGLKGIDNLEMHHLSKEEFDHRVTRNRGVRCSGTDIMVFMIDDAVPVDEGLIEHLVAAFDKRGSGDESVIMVYAGRLLDKDCAMAERSTRSPSYPEDSCIKTKEDLGRMGIKTFFAPNVCCAYDRRKFWFQGGFIQKTIFNEGMIFAGKAVLQNDYAIAYVAETRVTHSYNYGCATQFHRSFDLIVPQAGHPEVFAGTHSEGEGIRLVRQTARYLATHRRLRLVSELIVKSGFKYAGYRLGRCYHFLPVKLAVAYSMNKEYWK